LKIVFDVNYRLCFHSGKDILHIFTNISGEVKMPLKTPLFWVASSIMSSGALTTPALTNDAMEAAGYR
jgi:hypothetical protein